MVVYVDKIDEEKLNQILCYHHDCFSLNGLPVTPAHHIDSHVDVHQSNLRNKRVTSLFKTGHVQSPQPQSQVPTQSRLGYRARLNESDLQALKHKDEASTSILDCA